jgi:Ca2+-binding RTX toxin-like protein
MAHHQMTTSMVMVVMIRFTDIVETINSTVVSAMTAYMVKTVTTVFMVIMEAISYNGGTGHDYLNGGTGGDSIYGGAGNDTLYGDDGSDKLYGEDGNDRLIPDDGNNHLYGGAGNDVYDYRKGMDGFDIISDASGVADRFVFGGLVSDIDSWAATDSNNNGFVDALVIYGDDDLSESVTILNYFNDTAATAAASAAGTGAIESLVFTDQTLTFADVQGLV